MTTTDVKKLLNYWYKEADYSWDIAQTLWEKNKYPECLFFGHLTIEKLLKALVVANINKHAPPIHNLLKLTKTASIILNKEQTKYLEYLSKFYLAGRYDNYKMNFRKQCTKKYTEKHFAKLKEYYLWLKKEAKNKFHLL